MNPLDHPVVLLLYNRPALTERILRSVRMARPRKLWVVSDGPKPGDTEDEARVTEVRRLIERGVDWPCDLRRVLAASNLGCAVRVSSGLDAVFAEEPTAIILEDDCVPDPTFFRFCAELLDRYAEDERVAAISGDNFQDGTEMAGASYYFSRFPHCWGWATWRRAWRDYDHSMAQMVELQSDSWLAARVSSMDELRYWRHAFNRTLAGEIDSWANRWTYSCWRHERLTILPGVNLVSNIGFGIDATHTRRDSPVARLKTEPIGFPLVHPEQMRPDAAADRRTAQRLFHRPAQPFRLLARVVRRWPAFLSIRR